MLSLPSSKGDHLLGLIRRTEILAAVLHTVHHVEVWLGLQTCNGMVLQAPVQYAGASRSQWLGSAPQMQLSLAGAPPPGSVTQAPITCSTSSTSLTRYAFSPPT